MSSLWTPGGERPVSREPAADQPRPSGAEQPRPSGAEQPRPSGAEQPRPSGAAGQPSEEEVRREMAELQEQLARTPAEVVVANHAYGLFELAALHLSLNPPQLDQARVAIDALACLVEGMGARLGPASEELGAGLAQLRMAFVQVSAAVRAGAEPPAGAWAGARAGAGDASQPGGDGPPPSPAGDYH